MLMERDTVWPDILSLLKRVELMERTVLCLTPNQINLITHNATFESNTTLLKSRLSITIRNSSIHNNPV